MKIFKLQPYTDTLDSEHWQASTFKGPVTIRTTNENRARQIASLAFGIAVERRGLSQPTPVIPWSKPIGLAECIELDDSSYSMDGEEEILDPKEFNNEWKEPTRQHNI